MELRTRAIVSILRTLWPGLWRDLVLNTLISSSLFPKPLRPFALRAYGMDVGRCSISPKVWFGSKRVSIGDGTFVNYDCMFNTSARVAIGSNCDIGMGTLFVTSTHELDGYKRRAGTPYAERIIIGDGVWIGARATILPGATIGSGVVIAAGAVVRGKIESNAIYAGVPARKIRDLPGSSVLRGSA